MWKSTAIGLLVAAVVSVSWAGMRVDDRRVVRPGEGVGVISLGMTVPEVHAAMKDWGAEPVLTGSRGGPGAYLDERTGAAVEPWSTDSLGRGRWANTMRIFYVEGRVAQISVRSPMYTTTRGASARLNSNEFRRLHTSLRALPTTESWPGTVRPYDSERLGLAVTYVVIPGGNEAPRATEIFVHRPGQPVMVEAPPPEDDGG
jgi:hypothetical protein